MILKHWTLSFYVPPPGPTCVKVAPSDERLWRELGSTIRSFWSKWTTPGKGQNPVISSSISTSSFTAIMKKKRRTATWMMRRKRRKSRRMEKNTLPHQNSCSLVLPRLWSLCYSYALATCNPKRAPQHLERYHSLPHWSHGRWPCVQLGFPADVHDFLFIFSFWFAFLVTKESLLLFSSFYFTFHVSIVRSFLSWFCGRAMTTTTTTKEKHYSHLAHKPPDGKNTLLLVLLSE